MITAAHRAGARLEQACECLGLGFKTYQRWQQDPEREDRRTKAARAQAAPRPRSKRALSEAERQKIASRFCSADVVDLSLPQAFYVLLDRGEYYGSLRTIYRVMEEQNSMLLAVEPGHLIVRTAPVPLRQLDPDRFGLGISRT